MGLDVIPGKINRLSVGIDNDSCNTSESYVAFTFTPSMKDTWNHFHFALNRKQALLLRNWLTSYLRKTQLKKKGNNGRNSHVARKNKKRGQA